MALGNLKVTLSLVADQFISGIKTAEKEFQGLGKTLSSPVTAAVGAGMVAAGTAIAGGLLKATRSAADYGDAMFDLSQKTGISGASLAGYKLLADQSGSSIEGLATGMKILSKNMLAAASDSKGVQAQLFNALGISIKDASGNMRDLDEVIPQISEKFKGMEDGALKSAIATRLLGRSGETLIPFFNEGAGAIADATAKMQHYGAATTEAEEAMSDKFNDALAESSLAMQGLSNSIGFALIPDLTLLVEKGNEWIAVASQWVKTNPEIVHGMAELSVFLVGGGGILFGLTGIAAILPSVTAGFKLMGIGSIAAFGGLAVYIAGILATINRIKNAFEVGEKLREDPFAPPETLWQAVKQGATMANPLTGGIALKSWLQGINPAGPDRLAPPGLPTDWEKLSGGAGNADAEELRKLLADLEKKSAAKAAADEIKRFNDAVAQLKLSLTDTVPPSKELVAAITELDASGQMSSEVILALGKDIDTLKNSHNPLIQEIVRMIPWVELAAKAFQMEADTARLAEAAIKDLTFDPSVLIPAGGFGDPTNGPLGRGDIEGNQRRTRLDEATKSLEDQRKAMRDLGEDIVGLNAQGLSAIEIEQALGISLERVAESARELGVELDPMVDKLGRVQSVSQAWGDSFGGIVDSAVDMIVDLDFSFKRLGDIAKNTAKDMARSFLDGFFKPFKEKMVGIGEEAGGWLADLAYGGGGGGKDKEESGGWLGGLSGGGGVGGIWDRIKGNDDRFERLPIPGQGGGGTGGGMGQSGFGKFMAMDPVSMANGALDFTKKATEMIGKGRDSANEVVKSQNAFVNDTLKGILGDEGLSASNKLKMVGNAWEAYQTNLSRFSAAGGEGGVTANQAFATISPLVANIQRDLIKEGATEGGAGEGSVHNGDVVFNFQLPENVTNPEQWLDWWDKNKGGIRIRVAEGVFAMEGAIVTR